MSDGIYVALSGAIAQASNLETTAENLANASDRRLPARAPRISGGAHPRRVARARPPLHVDREHDARHDARPAARHRRDARLRDARRGRTSRCRRRAASATRARPRWPSAPTASSEPQARRHRAPGEREADPDHRRPGLDRRPDRRHRARSCRAATIRGRVKLVAFQQAGSSGARPGAALDEHRGVRRVPTPGKGPVEVGQVEESNANVVNSMTDLVSASRTFEAFQRVIDTFRDADRKVVTTVPDVS